MFPPLPEFTMSLSIERLRLPDRIRNTLLRAQITTIGELTTAFDTLLSIRGMGVSSVVVLEAALTSLHSSLTDDDTIDWPMYWQLQELDPEDVEPDEPARTLIDFPEPVKQLSIGHLHLPRLAYLSLVRAEILSIGDLCEARSNRFFRVERIGTTLIEKIETALSHLMDAMTEDDEIDWSAYWQAMGITVIPENYRGHGSDEQNTAALEDLIKAILSSDGDDRYWRILQRRFGLAKTKKLTLEELGDGLAITRERVRQIEQKCLDQLREVLIDNHYVGRSYHIHPAISTSLKSLIDILALKAGDLMLETDLFTLLQQSIPSTPRTNPFLHLLFTLTGLRRIEFNDPDLTPVWQRGATNVSERVQTIVSALDTLLTRDIAVPMEDFDILVRINKQLPKAQKLDLLELRRFLALCSTIEQREDGLFWGKFEYLKSRGNQVHRILTQAGEPVELASITRMINSALIAHGHHKLQERNLSNQLVGDDRFMPVGKTGQWALKEWEHVDTRSILDLMEHYLDVRNTGATDEEIFNYIRERRPASIGSIKMYLTYNPELFRKTDRTHWGLATWTETQNAQIWSRSQVADFVADVFKQRKSKEIPLKVIREALMEAAGVTLNQAVGLLLTNPVIRTRRENKGGARIAILQPDYKTSVQGPRKVARKATTIRDKVQQLVEALLQQAPGAQLPLAQLVEQLTAPPHSFHDKTIYLYLRQMPSLETVSIPGTKVKICRMKGAGLLSFPQVAQIQDAQLREDIEHAIKDLTEENIDIGLFRLGREFEVIIKQCLIKGSAAGKLMLQPSLAPDPTKWKLVHMVDYAKNQDLITDLGAVNLLRQERNNRAHGARPSLSERQTLMNAAQYLAGLYIDYILHFSQLLHAF